VNGIDTDKDVKTMLKNAHMGRGDAYRIIFFYEHGMYVFIGSIDTCEY